MIKTLMRGLNEKDMQAVVNSYDLKPFYYPTLFPIVPTPILSWKILEAQAGLRIAADVVSFNASIPKKTRDAVARIDGDIPKIGISREKIEEDLNEYNMLLHFANGNPGAYDLVRFWAEDTQYCWDGVANRLEWIALKQISLGKVKFTNSNNSAVVTQYDVDYQLPSDQKKGFQTGSADWGTPANAKPISKDFKAMVALGKAKGFTPKFAFMNMETFAKFVQTDEVIKMCASFANNALGLSQTPDLATVNSTLARTPWMYGLQIVTIDQDITIELPDGTRSTSNPFETDVVMFSESKVLGKTFHAPLADEMIEGSLALKVKRGHTLIKKYADESPIREVTEGLANAFPAWSNSGRTILMQTNADTWSK